MEMEVRSRSKINLDSFAGWNAQQTTCSGHTVHLQFGVLKHLDFETF